MATAAMVELVVLALLVLTEPLVVPVAMEVPEV
jgi:hypothetical protein